MLYSTVPLTTNWNSILWNKVLRKVRQIQIRIVKYLKQGKKRAVGKLQRLLRHSHYAALLAVRRVTENKGKNTAGVDGKLLNTPAKKWEAATTRPKSKDYKTLPLKRKLIPKKNGKKRPLGIPVMNDRMLQALHLIALEPIAESIADPDSYAFRLYRSTADAIESCFINLSQKTSAKWILEGDIKGCFDNISHDWLLKNIPTDKTVLKKWLKAGYIYKKELFPTEQGTPQGGIISPVLANMTLDGLEPKINQRFKRKKVNYVRYADDFIVTGESREILENEVKPLIEEFLEERGLKLSQEKTKITHIDEGFDFLGFNIRKYKGKLLIKPSKDSVKSIKKKIKEVIKNNRQSKQSNLIYLLNPIIRGWANYYKHVVSKKVFRVIDDAIYQKLWKWAKRRHSKKESKWIKAKYYKSEGNRNWVFGTDEVELVRMDKIPIHRHIKICGKANPFDIEYEEYFEKRWINSWNKEPFIKKKSLWKLQNGLCSRCKGKIEQNDEFHIHHKVMKCHGGNDTLFNLELLHGVCHRQLHSNDSQQHNFDQVWVT